MCTTSLGTSVTDFELVYFSRLVDCSSSETHYFDCVGDKSAAVSPASTRCQTYISTTETTDAFTPSTRLSSLEHLGSLGSFDTAGLESSARREKAESPVCRTSWASGFFSPVFSVERDCERFDGSAVASRVTSKSDLIPRKLSALINGGFAKSELSKRRRAIRKVVRQAEASKSQTFESHELETNHKWGEGDLIEQWKLTDDDVDPDRQPQSKDGIVWNVSGDVFEALMYAIETVGDLSKRVGSFLESVENMQAVGCAAYIFSRCVNALMSVARF